MISTARKLLNSAGLDDKQIFCLIYDDFEKEIGEAIISVAKDLLKQKSLKKFYYFNLDKLGDRPLKSLGDEVLNALSKADLIYEIIAKRQIKIGENKTVRSVISSYHKGNVRLGALFDAPIESFSEIFSYDPDDIKKLNSKLYSRLKCASEVIVKTPSGTDLRVSLCSYNLINQDADLKLPSVQHSLLAGEVYTCPKSVDGLLVIDGTMGGFFGNFSFFKPLKVWLENGRVVKYESANKLLIEKFSKYLEKYENFDRVGEIGFGTNTALNKFYGVIGIDEKYPGVHLAFGNPYPKRTGANWKCKVHIDAVMNQTSVWIDGEKVLDDGKYII